MFNNIPPSGFPQIDLSQDVKRINAELSSMTSACTNIITDITAETATVTGNPISLTDALATDAISVVAEIEPEQDLHGYGKPWAGGAGKNKLPLVLADIKSNNTSGTWSGNAYTLNDVTFTVNTDSDGNVTGITANGTASAEITFWLVGHGWGYAYAEKGVFSAGDYVLNGGIVNNKRIAISSYNSDGTEFMPAISTATSVSGKEFTIPSTADSTTGWLVYIRINNGEVSTNATFRPMIRLATETDATFAPYTNICPISGMDSVTVTATDGTDTNTATASLGTTIYGGTVDMTEGSGSVKYASVDMGDLAWAYASATNTMEVVLSGAKAPESDAVAINAICSVAYAVASNERATASGTRMYMFANGSTFYVRDTGYTDADTFKTDMTGQTIVYELATPTTLSLTPATLAMLEGENTVSTDAEEVSVEYIKNTLVGRVRRLEEEQ